ncbi:hypothetical protein ACVIJ6_001441 [Bradyrhizobium sp. USDA 4369]
MGAAGQHPSMPYRQRLEAPSGGSSEASPFLREPTLTVCTSLLGALRGLGKPFGTHTRGGTHRVRVQALGATLTNRLHYCIRIRGYTPIVH